MLKGASRDPVFPLTVCNPYMHNNKYLSILTKPLGLIHCTSGDIVGNV